VRCWGPENDQGQQGNTEAELPSSTDEEARNVILGAKAKHIAAGDNHSCALLYNGHVRCWGSLGAGLGRTNGFPHSPNTYYPKEVGDVVVGGSVSQIATGREHTCALLRSGSVRCWGRNKDGQLGYGHTDTVGDENDIYHVCCVNKRTSRPPPTKLSLSTPAKAGDVPLGGRAVQITAGYKHTCALLDTGKIRCWGNNEHGQLGYGHTRTIGDDETPASVGDVPAL
jgi:alpha-tubulin suppressor-like RCC1 family protein